MKWNFFSIIVWYKRTQSQLFCLMLFRLFQTCHSYNSHIVHKPAPHRHLSIMCAHPSQWCTIGVAAHSSWTGSSRQQQSLCVSTSPQRVHVLFSPNVMFALAGKLHLFLLWLGSHKLLSPGQVCLLLFWICSWNLQRHLQSFTVFDKLFWSDTFLVEAQTDGTIIYWIGSEKIQCDFWVENDRNTF